jgi:pyruvate kinase
VAVWSATGATARMVAKHRLPMPVIGLTYDERVYRQMNLLFGVIPLKVEPLDNPAAMAVALDEQLLRRNLAAPGDLIVVVTSTKPTTPGATDTALVRRVGEKH